MKRKIIIGLLLLLLIGGIVLGIAAYNANSIIAKYKPDLEALASKSLGSKVTLGNLRTSFFPGVNVVVDELAVSGTEAERFVLKNLTLHLKILPLLSGALDIEKLEVVNPDITIVKSKDGLRIPGVPKGGSNGKSEPTADQKTSSKLDVSVDKVQITDAALTYKDLESGKTFSLSNVSLLAPSIDLKGDALTAEKISLTVLQSLISIDAKMNLADKSGKASLQSKGIKLEGLLPEIALSGEIAPDLTVSFSPGSYRADGTITTKDIGLQAGSAAISKIVGTIGIASEGGAQKFSSNNLEFSFGGQRGKVEFEANQRPTAINITPLHVSIFGGTFDASPKISMGDVKTFDTPITIASMAIESLLSALKPGNPPTLSGTIQSIKGSVSGTLGADLMRSLQGDLNANIANGMLHGVNIGGTTLKAVKDIPLVAGALFGHVPPAYQQAMSNADTLFTSLVASTNISNGGLTLRSFNLTGPVYSVSGNGRVEFDMSVGIHATIIFSKDFSQALAVSVKEIRAILNPEGLLAIPIEIEGKLPSVSIKPNISKLIESAGKNLLKQKAGDLLERAIGGKKGLGGLLGF